MDFLQLDPGSGWVQSNLPLHFERAGQAAEARESAKKVSADDPFRGVLVACFDPSSPTQLDKEVRAATPGFFADPDPENRYWDAALMAACGRKDLALHLIKSAIDGRYCAYTALQKDPLMASLRGTQEFNQLLTAARECRSNFIAEGMQAH